MKQATPIKAFMTIKEFIKESMSINLIQKASLNIFIHSSQLSLNDFSCENIAN